MFIITDTDFELKRNFSAMVCPCPYEYRKGVQVHGFLGTKNADLNLTNGWFMLPDTLSERWGHGANAPWNSSNVPENPGTIVTISTPLREWAVGTPSPHSPPPLMGSHQSPLTTSWIGGFTI